MVSYCYPFIMSHSPLLTCPSFSHVHSSQKWIMKTYKATDTKCCNLKNLRIVRKVQAGKGCREGCWESILGDNQNPPRKCPGQSDLQCIQHCLGEQITMNPAEAP